MEEIILFLLFEISQINFEQIKKNILFLHSKNVLSMATENEKKTREGNVQLHTFESWGKRNVIGFETNGNMVVAVWCKLCAKHKDKLLANPTLRGKAKSDALKGEVNQKMIFSEMKVLKK